MNGGPAAPPVRDPGVSRRRDPQASSPRPNQSLITSIPHSLLPCRAIATLQAQPHLPDTWWMGVELSLRPSNEDRAEVCGCHTICPGCAVTPSTISAWRMG